MNFTGYKVGFWPNGAGLDKPGDRRRFVFYAQERKIDFEIANLRKEYDIIYLTMGCDISAWLKYKKRHPNVKLVFEIIDSYFLQKTGLQTILRGLIKFLNGKESTLYLNYQAAIVKMLKSADAVVCSSASQKEFISRYNRNVHISLDFFSNDISRFKTDFSTNQKLKLVWEGQGYTVHNLLYIREVFRKLADKVELHIITDPVIVYPFKIFNKKTSSILSRLPCDHYFYVWERKNFSEIIAGMDLAIIPLDNRDELLWNKPENKLLLFWQIGIPALTSNSPAYTNVMNEAGLPFLCCNKADWIKKIEAYIDMTEKQRRDYAAKAAAYIKEHHSKEIIIRKWDEIFSSLFTQKAITGKHIVTGANK